jgi:hypothetical protein
MEDPAFLAYLKQIGEQPLKPDPEDYDFTACVRTANEQAEQHQLARERKIMRLYRRWKAQH